MALKASVTKLGVVAGGRRQDAALKAHFQTQVNETDRPVNTPIESLPAAKDYCVERNGVRFAGTHLIIELWGAKHLDDIERAETAMRDGAVAAGATVLRVDLHKFEPNGGITGVAVLAESHISIHTWPERSYAALDIFMCGAADPYKAIPAIRAAFQPSAVQIVEQRRGIMA